jgi:arylsulfatase A-like enzyme
VVPPAPSWCRKARWRAAALLAVSLFASAFIASSAPRPPNIVFILADDLGYGHLGSYGQRRIRTPRLDRMAGEGVRFTQAYAGSTVCAPSRASLMTGLHQGHARIRGNTPRLPLRAEDVTIAEVLRGAGYRTAAIGKWGLGDAGTTGAPTRQGFDHWFGYLDQAHAHDSFTDHLWRDERRVAIPKGTFSHDLFTKEALDFVRRERKRPFFLYLAYTLPHANSTARRMDTPTEEPYAHEPWPAPERAVAALVTRLDTDVGRLLDLIGELGLDRDTVVFFTSDNGPHREGGVDPAFHGASGPLRGIKRDLYEGGIRVPMIVRWPGRIAPGQVSDYVWAFWDVLPTMAALAGVSPPAAIDGLSIVPALVGAEPKPHEYLYWEFFERGFQQAIRAERWKGVRTGFGRPLELYDLSADPGETSDVATAHADVVGRLERLLSTARTDSPYWPTVTQR